MVFIAHDLAVVKNISDRVAVMYLGKLCEIATPDTLYREPAHHYTAALLASIPEPDPDAPRRWAPSRSEASCPPRSTRPRGAGSGPGARGPRSAVRPRSPQMQTIGPGHFVACHFPLARRVAAGAGTGTGTPTASPSSMTTGASLGPSATGTSVAGPDTDPHV